MQNGSPGIHCALSPCFISGVLELAAGDSSQRWTCIFCFGPPSHWNFHVRTHSCTDTHIHKHTHTHTHIHTHKHTHKHTHTHKSTQARTHTYTQTNTVTCTHIHVYTHTLKDAHTHKLTHTCTHTNNIHTRIQIFTHTQMSHWTDQMLSDIYFLFSCTNAGFLLFSLLYYWPVCLLVLPSYI